MAQFVVNEWLWADLAASDRPTVQRRAITFLEQFANSDHQMILVQDSAFDHKAWSLCASYDTFRASLGKLFVLLVRQDSDRCLILSPTTLAPLPKHLANEVKPDDHYLLQAQLACPGAILVTTDSPLRNVLLKNGMPCITREEFFNTYFNLQF